VRVAAAGDLHCSPEREDHVRAELAGVAAVADVLLLAGDLTTCGEPEQAAALARVCRELELPVLAVLGNHDWHADRSDEVVAELAAGSITVLDGGSAQLDVRGCEIGIAGVKGFVGGFAGHSHLDDFGEPSLRALYREVGEDVAALDRALGEIALCAVRVVLLHYAPTGDTLVGEPDGIWAFLGNDRLGAPILQHEPDLVLHGHAHAGSFEGSIGEVPVRNVSLPVIGRGFALFDLHPHERRSATLH
jgi:Icc-related predicted phosphoesterase